MWAFRYIHVALDTLVLIGVLRERSIGEREEAGAGMGGSGGSNNTSTSGPITPPLV